MQIATDATSRIPREKLLQIARSLPADLSVLAQLGEMLQDFNTELAEIATLLRRDVALGSRIIRISNSAAYGGNGEIASIEAAVNRVGFGEVMKLVGAGAVSRLAEQGLDAYGITAEDLRSNMLFGAFAGEALAKAAGLDPKVAYTAGLVRTLGIMVLNKAWDQIEKVPSFDPARWSSYSAWEANHFGQNHCAIAASILTEWRFPAEMGEAIKVHLLEATADHEQKLAVVLNVANSLAERKGRGLAGERSWWEITPLKLEALGLSESDLEQATESAETACTTALAAFTP